MHLFYLFWVLICGAIAQDPDNELEIARLACNRSVAKELRVSEEERCQLKALLDASGGSFSRPRVSLQFIGDSNGPSPAEWKSLNDEKLAENKELIDSILDPLQRERLRQIAYRVEISRVGLSEALFRGFLGKAVTLRSDRLAMLEVSAREIESKLASVCLDILCECRQSVFDQLLDYEQREIADKLLGKTFYFVEERLNGIRWSQHTLVEYVPSIPNPKSLLDTVPFALNRSVSKELGCSPQDVAILRNMFRKRGGSLATPSVAYRETPSSRPSMAEILTKHQQTIQEIKNELRSILSPSKENRLRELIYQIEICRVGWAEALEKGYLGQSIVLRREQKSRLDAVVLPIQRRAQKEIASATFEAQNIFFSKLDTEQQEKIRVNLGKPFYFVEDAF